jgi:hypothetical protein
MSSEPDWKGFALAVMRDWPEVGELDGFDLQQLGEKHGLLVKEWRTVPCSDGENCACNEYVVSGEQVECYRIKYERV